MLLNELFIPLPEGIGDPNIFKALFVLGAPGSGKTTISRILTGWAGLRNVTPDQFYEMFLKQRGAQKFTVSPDLDSDPEWIRSRALATTRLEKFLNGRLGLVIDATGRYAPSIERQINKLRSLGYDVAVMYVKTDTETAVQRQQTRDRQMNPEIVRQFHQDIQNNISQYADLVGDNFVVLNNSGDSAAAAINNPQDFESAGRRKLTADQWFRRWLRTPVDNTEARSWRHSQTSHSQTSHSLSAAN
jgi:dephospho-CoA kinase